MKQLYRFISLISLLTQQPATAQNVGIGTTTPSRAKFEVHGAVGLTSAIFGGEGQGVALTRDIPGIGFNSYFDNSLRLMKNGTAAFQYFSPATGSMHFEITTNGNADQTISSRRIFSLYYDGSVRIGESGSKPESSLFVERGLGNEGTAGFAGTSYISYFNYGSDENTYLRAGKNNGTVFINDFVANGKTAVSGNLGINTPNPTYPLEIFQPPADKGLCIRNFNTGSTWEFRVTGGAGTLNLYHNTSYVGSFSNSGSYSSISDRRLKTDIYSIPSILENVLKLEPVRYKMTVNNPFNQESIGFIAQDVKAIFPELVHVATDSASGPTGIRDINTLDYSGFGVIAIKAIQEQQHLIMKLQTELQQLSERLNTLEKKNINKE
jgi:predicted metallopeptidase